MKGSIFEAKKRKTAILIFVVALIAGITCLMISVADSFDAMNSNRVYRKMLTKERIISEIENNKGRQFDPEVADVMLKLLKNGTIAMEG